MVNSEIKNLCYATGIRVSDAKEMLNRGESEQAVANTLLLFLLVDMWADYRLHDECNDL